MRSFGPWGCRFIIKKFVRVTDGILDEEEKQTVRDYLFHINYQNGTTENAIMICFDTALESKLPLGT